MHNTPTDSLGPKDDDFSLTSFVLLSFMWAYVSQLQQAKLRANHLMESVQVFC